MGERIPSSARASTPPHRATRIALATTVVLATLYAALLPHLVEAEEPLLPGSEACTMCHETGREGRRTDDPPRFDARALRASPHADLECTTCHSDVSEDEFPHEEKLTPVACGDCHSDEQLQHEESLHGRAAARGDRDAPACVDCHGRHDVLRPSDQRSPVNTASVPALCGRCHHEGSPVQITHDIPQDSILTNYSQSIHGEGLFKKGLLTTAVCTSCHTAHQILPHTDPRSSIAHANVAATCTQCHVRIEAVHRKVIGGELWEKQPHLVPVCVECHQPHQIRKVFYDQGMADKDCLSCHARRDLVAEHDGGVDSMFVDADELASSRHNRIACARCHTEVQPSDVRPCRTIKNPVNCSVCHAETVEIYEASTHGELAARGSPDAPTCAECHGTHGTPGRVQTDSPTYAKNIPELCGKCHRAGQKAALRYKGAQQHVVENYIESIHGKGLLESGLTVTATCADCHTAHGELPHTDPGSSVHRDRVAETCAQCHRGIYELFMMSVHVTANTKTDEPLPVCSDCHSAHTITRTDRSGFRLEIMDQCGRCHEKLTETYFDTYHGKVSKLGYPKTAKCDDCHGAHDILPVSDPKSHLSRANIVATCARCHPGSNRRFAGYLTHATHHDPVKYPKLFWSYWLMTGLLVGTFAIAGLHTLAWLPRSLRHRLQLKAPDHEESTVHYRRFPKLYRNLHVMVIVSFLGLALTGMTLKFSYTQWAWVLSRLLGGFEAAGFIHRVCAIITFAYFAIHVWDLFRRKRESGVSWKQFLTGTSGMLPGWNDAREFWQSVLWFVGRGPRPLYGRWTYWEKFDYFAVFWGVAIIGGTGLLLWFPTLFTIVLPGWFINVATIIHSDEALLATGFIFTVHFFNTHFRPEKFPMDTVIFTGTVPLEEFKQDRPAEYEEMVRTGALDSRLVGPPDPAKVRAWKIFGAVALATGLGMVLLILYAALFGYR